VVTAEQAPDGCRGGGHKRDDDERRERCDAQLRSKCRECVTRYFCNLSNNVSSQGSDLANGDRRKLETLDGWLDEDERDRALRYYEKYTKHFLGWSIAKGASTVDSRYTERSVPHQDSGFDIVNDGPV